MRFLLIAVALIGVSGVALAARTVDDAALLRLLARHKLTIPTGHSQVLLVTAPSWSSRSGELRRLQKGRGGWHAAGPAVQVRLGRRGLARGRGLHDGMPGALAGAPVKREGDARSPAGIFALGTAFGPGAEPPYTPGRWPWRRVDGQDRFVDDPRSPFYNSWQRQPRTGAPAWRSAEVLSRYHLALVIEHNPERRPGAGSAIFLHDTAGDGASVGCTVLATRDLLAVLRWLAPEARPILVQVPKQ
jgi:L,D-peptidoglycan transpeptidase YkuD (ErfK/YbiS/YcfS/YnhG family)